MRPVSVPTGPLSRVIAFALAQVGKPYRRNATGPTAFDCSGLLLKAFATVGIQLPHRADAIHHYGHQVSYGAARAGDVLWWPGHVALYLGAGLMVEAPHTGADVRVVSTRNRRPAAVLRLI